MGDFFCGGWNFSKLVSVGPTFIREMRVMQVIGMAFQRGNSACILETVTDSRKMDEVYLPENILQ